MATKKAKSKLHRKGQKLGVTRRPMESDSALSHRIHQAIALNASQRVLKVFQVGGLNLAELREVPHKKKKVPRLYLYIKRGGARGIFSIFNVSSAEIQAIIGEGAQMFHENNPDAQEFQDLCFDELKRRL